MGSKGARSALLLKQLHLMHFLTCCVISLAIPGQLTWSCNRFTLQAMPMWPTSSWHPGLPFFYILTAIQIAYRPHFHQVSSLSYTADLVS